MVTKAFTFPRSHFIGFDHVWNEIEKLSTSADSKIYPPHNVVKIDESNYLVELALAGYKKEDLSVEVRDGILVVSGETNNNSEREFLHRGISSKKFTRTFRMSEHVVVRGADFVDGLLAIKLEIVLPEDKRPRKIEIGSTGELQRELLNE